MQINTINPEIDGNLLLFNLLQSQIQPWVWVDVWDGIHPGRFCGRFIYFVGRMGGEQKNNQSKKSPTRPLEHTPDPQLPVYEGKSFHICILGHLGSGIFLESSAGNVPSKASSGGKHLAMHGKKLMKNYTLNPHRWFSFEKGISLTHNHQLKTPPKKTRNDQTPSQWFWLLISNQVSSNIPRHYIYCVVPPYLGVVFTVQGCSVFNGWKRETWVWPWSQWSAGKRCVANCCLWKGV